jgi:uncharacterized membrane protein
MNPLRHFRYLDAHHRLLIAGEMSLCAFLLLMVPVFTKEPVSLPTKLIAAWNAFAYTELALAWNTLIGASHDQIRRTARRQDLSRTIIFVVVIIAACTSLLAVSFLLGPAKGLPESHRTSHVVLSVLAVLGSWFLLNTVFTFRYAHLFYQRGHTVALDKQIGGVVFPGETQPDYLDFAYFTFVIGMTCQVSDVAITSRAIRHLALLHGVLAFGFNTVILALSINLISGLF